MVNLDNKLTVDDLIVEYMIYKVKNGYEPQFTATEFIDFLRFFTCKMPVEDVLYENPQLFQRFFARKAESDWARTIWTTNKKQLVPHMDMTYSEEEKDYIIKANYQLSNYDKSVINTYFMDNRMGQYDDFKGTAYKIRAIIGEYLTRQLKRKIDETVVVTDDALIIGKYLATEIVKNIWDSYVSQKIKSHQWPEQCRDINKYLLETDLAEIIGLKSIKSELLDFYKIIAKRIAILYQKDKHLKISTCSGEYLAKANYDLLIDGYQKIFGLAFGDYKSSMNIDLENQTFTESHKIDGVYMWDEDPDIKTQKAKIGNADTKKLVWALDKSSENN